MKRLKMSHSIRFSSSIPYVFQTPASVSEGWSKELGRYYTTSKHGGKSPCIFTDSVTVVNGPKDRNGIHDVIVTTSHSDSNLAGDVKSLQQIADILDTDYQEQGFGGRVDHFSLVREDLVNAAKAGVLIKRFFKLD
jgi:hypothetical protein